MLYQGAMVRAIKWRREKQMADPYCHRTVAIIFREVAALDGTEMKVTIQQMKVFPTSFLKEAFTAVKEMWGVGEEVDTVSALFDGSEGWNVKGCDPSKVVL